MTNVNTLDLPTAVADLDDAYLHVQLLLAQRRAGSEEPQRAALWHTLAVIFAEEQARRGMTSTAGPSPEAVREVQEQLMRDAVMVRAEYEEASGQPPTMDVV